MGYAKGTSGNPAGRPRGVPNRLTMTIKAAIEAALEAEGGTEYLRKLAREEPAAFASLLRALVPNEMKVALTSEPLVQLRAFVRTETLAGTRELVPSESPSLAVLPAPVVAIPMVGAGDVIA